MSFKPCSFSTDSTIRPDANRRLTDHTEGADNSSDFDSAVSQPAHPIQTAGLTPEIVRPVSPNGGFEDESQETILNREIWGWRDQGDGFYA